LIDWAEMLMTGIKTPIALAMNKWSVLFIKFVHSQGWSPDLRGRFSPGN